MPDIGVFSRAGAQKVAEATRRVLGTAPKGMEVPYRPRVPNAGPGLKYAKLTAALSAPATFISTPTEAAAVFMKKNSSGTLVVGATFTVKNRWPALTLASGKYMIVGRVAGEWMIIQAECP